MHVEHSPPCRRRCRHGVTAPRRRLWKVSLPCNSIHRLLYLTARLTRDDQEGGMFGTGYGPPCRTLHAARCTQHRTALGRGSPPALVGSASNLQCGGWWAVGVGRWCFSNLGESSIFLLLAGLAAGSRIRDTVDTLMGGGEEFLFPDLVEFDSSNSPSPSPSPASTHRIDPSHRPPALPHCERKDQRKKEVEPRNPRNPRIDDRGSRIRVHGAIQTSQLLANSPRSL